MCTVCWNDAHRKVFGYKQYESVKELQLAPIVVIYILTTRRTLLSVSSALVIANKDIQCNPASSVN